MQSSISEMTQPVDGKIRRKQRIDNLYKPWRLRPRIISYPHVDKDIYEMHFNGI